MDDFITEFDVFQLFKNNESFLYFLNNYKTEDKNTKRGMWKAKSNIMTENFQKGLIDKEILNNYIQKSTLSLNTNEGVALDEDNYKYLDLIRLSLMTKNYDFIFNELKPKFYVEGET